MTPTGASYKPEGDPMIDEQQAPTAGRRVAKHRRETPVQWLAVRLTSLRRASQPVPVVPEYSSPVPVEGETMSLSLVKAGLAEPKQITETTPEHTRNQLLDALDNHLARIRELAGTQDSAGTRERIHGAIVALYQLDASVAEADRKARESETAEAFDDWSRGGEDA